MPEAHLGGHLGVTHMDQTSMLYLRDRYAIKTAYDVGCGPGGMVELMIARGIDCLGIDGDDTIERSAPVLIHDFAAAPLTVEPRDFAWCVEFLEHVAEQYMDNYFVVFQQCRVVLATAAQTVAGHHHVNVKPVEWWQVEFSKRGLELDIDATAYVRQHSSMKRSFIRNTGMVFTNER